MIRYAREEDINGVMSFIDTYWRKGHILGNNIEFFRYEHLLDEGLTYVISETESGHINAILGYIPYGKENRDVMTVMWMANHTAEPSLGIELFNFLKDSGNVRIMASPGSNKKLRGLYNYLGYQFGKMTQWYRLNGDKRAFDVAIIDDGDIPKVSGEIKYTLYVSWDHLESEFDFEKYKKLEPKPYKEKWYIKKRYFDHPIYDYKVYGLKGCSKKSELLMVFREIKVNNAKVIRLLDCIGNYSLICKTTKLIDSLLVDSGAEYVDCYETGLDDKVFTESGWRKTEDTNNIIPNYFAPFTQENIDIFYFSTDPDVVLFKADGDQDRPN